MSDDDASHGSQSDAGAFEFVRAVESLENAEELIGIFHVEARAIVADEERCFAVAFGRRADAPY